ncbi:MAG: ribonuclease HII [Bryobacterales bacterium]|nr:ribonuclease HII [Bryobacteraceae bacterium]MDW8355217.1 ribonuclease HII [Bryobacterales bacterium]
MGRALCHSRFEWTLRRAGFCRIAGVDEAGRGALFGPVFAAAVILAPGCGIRGLRDSKQLDARSRELLAEKIRRSALAWAVASADAAEIDRINVYQASRLAMKRAVEQLRPAPDFLLVDALSVDVAIPQRALIRGDARCRSIAAASILAKVHRDQCLQGWDAVYPQYGLGRNKGYGTPEHKRALAKYGPTPEHRRSFLPVRQNVPSPQPESMRSWGAAR